MGLIAASLLQGQLREPGTAICMVVPEGDAERYKRIHSTFFGLANDCLRNGELHENSAPVLFNLDEIGSIHIPDLPAALGVGRGRRMTYALGYQNIAQLYHQYSADGGDAVLGSVGAMVFLPGVDQRTAEYASKRLGMTTTLQSSSVDVHGGDKFDSERTSEVGRPLMDASEIRQMVKYKQAVAIISNAPPVCLTYPKFARLENPPPSSRETKFRQAMTNKPEAKGPDAENGSLSNSIAGQISESGPPPESSVNQWSQASKSNATEFEYDPTEIDEDYSPLFDDSFHGWRGLGA
ncbi:MAG: type IV secretory system conjugative DNA transfer family protein [Blastocatellia bacterium]